MGKTLGDTVSEGEGACVRGREGVCVSEVKERVWEGG